MNSGHLPSQSSPPNSETPLEKTLGIIKPEAVTAGHVEAILDLIQQHGLKIEKKRKLSLTRELAAAFYEIHQQKPFFNDLVSYMTSGEIIVLIISGANAVAKYRALMGSTDPLQAEPGTIRKIFGESIERNAVHGSDSTENASREIAFFFKDV
ncbi:nucleoside diphosphate kinase [Spirochaetota bacterium]|nr:nucleoside diphosphate kinase [Spirochaetota bacterium]